jgi:hypothetical protein
MNKLATKQQVLSGVILDYITKHPEKHDQSDWFKGNYDPDATNSCGTTACVAGYAILFSNDPRFKYEKNVDGRYELVTIKPKSNDVFFDDAGMELLGLASIDASILFYETNNEQARQALEYLARGEQIDWSEIIENFDMDEYVDMLSDD